MGLRYVGRPPDSDYSVIPRTYADGRYGELRVDAAYIAGETAVQAGPLVTSSYVDTQDAVRAKKATVDAADANYLMNSQIGAPNGIVPTDGSGYIPAINTPTLQTDRKPFVVPATTVTLNGDRIVSQLTPKEYQAASISIADPGYPYIPLFFVQIQGGAPNGNRVNSLMGTGSYGQISVLRNDDVKYAYNLATSHKSMGHHTALPYAEANTTPTSMPPCVGARSFGLWLGLYSGTAYTFNSTGLVFYAICYPGLT